GGRWFDAGTLPSADINAGDRFGSAISVDGDRIAVGAPGRDVQKGAVFVFRRGSDGSWTQEAVLGSRRATTNAQVGSTLLLKGDKIWAGGATASSFVGMVVGFRSEGRRVGRVGG